MSGRINNCVSIDIESWAYGDTPELRNLTNEERKRLDNGFVVASTRRIIDLLKEFEAKITLFVVGQQLDWYPEIADLILEAGHELGLHSYVHYPIRTLDALREDLERAAPLVDKYRIRGYRAPLISLPAGGFELLREFGFQFDSSVYGPWSLAGPHGGITEIPISALRFRPDSPRMFLPRHLSMSVMLGQAELAFGSSYFTGLFGRKTRLFMRYLNGRGRPAVIFLHNWQVFGPENATFPTRGYLLRHPGYLPFTRNLELALREMLTEFQIDKMSAFSDRLQQQEKRNVV